jgi:hypothetical protein
MVNNNNILYKMSRSTKMRKTRKMRNFKKRKITLKESKKRKNRKFRKTRGGNNIGANCNDPNFSIYNTNLLKLFPYKGGELQLDDPYKNSEGPQF